MIEFNEAFLKAEKHFGGSAEYSPFAKIYFTDDMWIFFERVKGKSFANNHTAIVIFKETGELKKFELPSHENFEILRNANLIDLE